MQSHPLRRWLPPAIGLTLLACAITAQAATGVRVIVQAWDPRMPDAENNTARVDHPTLVSDSLQGAWDRARPKICEQLQLRMGMGGAARGETLRGITCLLDEQVALDVMPAGQNALRATFAVSGYVEATSTTPDIIWGIGVDRAADPRFSIALTAKLDLIVAVQPNRDQTLRVTQAKFTLNNATLDSQNFSGDLAKWVVEDMLPFFGGPDYKRMAEDAVNAVSVDFANDFNAGLAPVNAQLAGPSDAIRVGVSASGNYISVAFAPREIAPVLNGQMTGMVRWNPAQLTPRNGCQSFNIRATVQTGPVPMFTPNAVAPTRQVGTFQASPVDVGACAFTLSGIAAGWPNTLAPLLDGSAVKSGGGSLYRVNHKLFGDGWNGRVVVPQPVADARNYLVSASVEATAIESQGSAALKRRYRSDPRINPADVHTQRVEPVSDGVIKARTADGVMQQVEAVSLNPQPLPPEPDPDPRIQALQAQAIAEPDGSDAAIIIVGGKSAYHRIKQATPAKAIEGKVAQPQR